MAKRKRYETSPSLEVKHKWAKIDPKKSSEVSVCDRNDYRRNLQFLFDTSDRSALKIYKFSEPRDRKIRIIMERADFALKRWIEMNRPTDGNSLNQRNFLDPIRSLLESVQFLRTEFGDFSFSSSDVWVSNAKNAPRLKILCVSDITSATSTFRCMSSIAEIIEFWFDHYGIPIENHDLRFFLYCLKNLDRFPPGGRVQVLSAHPVFYTEQERDLLFEMVQKLHRAIDVYCQGFLKRKIGIVVASALNIVNGHYYSVRTKWYEEAKLRGIRPNNAIDKCLNARPRTKQMKSFLRSIRNISVHVHKHFEPGDDTSMARCAKDVEELVPGCYSAFFLVILKYGLEGHFISKH